MKNSLKYGLIDNFSIEILVKRISLEKHLNSGKEEIHGNTFLFQILKKQSLAQFTTEKVISYLINKNLLTNVFKYQCYKSTGCLQYSVLIKNNLIDHYVPFLPLERSHILRCIEDYLKSRNVTNKSQKFRTDIANSLRYFPKDSGLFCISGCQGIQQKVDYFMEMDMVENL